MVAKAKPKKPRPDFPLFVHASGRWAKKIRQKLVYFGKVADDPKGVAAESKYLDQREDLQAGRKPRATTGGLTIADLINRFLTAKRLLVDTREMSPKSFTHYHKTYQTVTAYFGRTRAVADLRVEDFDGLRSHFAKTLGPVALGNEIRRTRTLFKYAYDAGLVDIPIRVGPQFKEPSKRLKRQARHAAGPKMFEASDVRLLLEKSSGQLRAMILLGINAGFGQTDCATLPRTAIDLDAGWIDFPRPKTGMPRRIPLWQETRDALAVALEARPKPKRRADDQLAFLTRQGHPWVRMREKAKERADDPTEWTPIDSVLLMFGRLLTDCELKRPGLGFYALRHTFRTIADESKDQPAVNAIMGHDDGTMANVYRERIGDDRLRAVVDHVRGWLFG